MTSSRWKLRSSKWHRWAYTLRYHRFSQLARRLQCRLRLKLPYATPKVEVPEWGGSVDLHPVLAALAKHRRTLITDQDVDLDAYCFEFLGTAHCFAQPIPWAAAGQDLDHLWRFHLHYQEYLLLEKVTASQGKHLITSWIEGCAPTSHITRMNGWHPFCISKRVPVWILWLSLFRHQLSAASRTEDQILQSIAEQMEYLCRHLERDVGGNHLLENARALVFAGTALNTSDSSSWLSLASSILERQLPQQILPTGEHFERACSYHLDVFDLVLDIVDLTAHLDAPVWSTCREVAQRMMGFTRSVLLPNDGLPQFGDSPRRTPAAVKSMIQRASKTNLSPDGDQSSPRQDYWVQRANSSIMIFDTGPAGPDHLPAHMHADLTQIEYWHHGDPVFVDIGVFDYADTPMRKYCRGTEAHNVLQIDGLDQFDFWSRFRVGYRGWPTACTRSRGPDSEWTEVTHNAYRRIGVPEVGRRLVRVRDDNWICVDWAMSLQTNERALCSRLHLHPSCSLVAKSARHVTLETRSNATITMRALGKSALRIDQGWFCPALGEKQESQVICVEQVDSLPTALGWALGDWGNAEPALQVTRSKWRLMHGDDQLAERRFA